MEYGKQQMIEHETARMCYGVAGLSSKARLGAIKY